ncbi:hypothetical protein E2562_003659 [Oryza meyeriana var. granulata]|uniref:Uncharacterized protein n=1 Tax=Oryza meyeriana var. granulata TaxID=110450 RepID=A0A6G1C297_9ORYZ|nr:hypothetical protein E2562_003659 [Oryza meyeriana var. granulata]
MEPPHCEWKQKVIERFSANSGEAGSNHQKVEVGGGSSRRSLTSGLEVADGGSGDGMGYLADKKLHGRLVGEPHGQRYICEKTFSPNFFMRFY